MRAREFFKKINESTTDASSTVVAEVMKLIGEGHTEVSPDVITTKVSAALGRPFMLKDLVACNNSSPDLQHYIASINPSKIKFSTDILTVKNEDPIKAKEKAAAGVASMASRAASRPRLGESVNEGWGRGTDRVTIPDDSTLYWSGKGPLQKEYDALYNELVPSQGKADTIEGEVLRAASKIVYRHYNDGDEFNQASFEQLVPYIGAVTSYDDLAHKATEFAIKANGNYTPNPNWDSLDVMEYGPEEYDDDDYEEDDDWDDEYEDPNEEDEDEDLDESVEELNINSLKNGDVVDIVYVKNPKNQDAFSTYDAQIVQIKNNKIYFKDPQHPDSLLSRVISDFDNNFKIYKKTKEVDEAQEDSSNLLDVEVTNQGAVYVNGTRITGRNTKYGVHRIVGKASGLRPQDVPQWLNDNGFSNIELYPAYAKEFNIPVQQDEAVNWPKEVPSDDSQEQDDEDEPHPYGHDLDEARTTWNSDWYVYNPETLAVKKKFRTYKGAKQYAEANGLKLAASEWYHDKINTQKQTDEGWESGPEERSSRERDPDAEYDDMRQQKADAEAQAQQAKRPQTKVYTLTGRGPNYEPNYKFPGEYATQDEAAAARAKLMADPKTPNPRDIGISARTKYLDEGALINDRKRGKDAHKLGKSLKDNPNKPGSLSHSEWNYGWNLANKKNTVKEGSVTPLRDLEDYQAKKKALQDIQSDPSTGQDPELSTELIRRLAGLEKQRKDLK